MSGKFIVQVSLERDGALPEDAVVNTWHFDSDQTFAEDADDVANRVKAFYQAIGLSLSPICSGNGVIKVYDHADTPPRTPGIILPFTFTPSGGTGFPAEVSICLSMEAAPASGVKQARRRGRVFLGPIPSGVQGAQVGGDITIVGGTRTTILDAAHTLARGPDAGDGRLAVYSPTIKNLGGTLDDAYSDVVKLWIDDRFDTQRRRGSKPTSRQVVTIP